MAYGRRRTRVPYRRRSRFPVYRQASQRFRRWNRSYRYAARRTGWVRRR